jgi:adenylate kinase family enzyme
MKKIKFPVFKTKIEGLPQTFNLTDPKQRKEYFQAKASEEIGKIKAFLADGNTFIAYLLGKKNTGKGTYAKLFIEIFGSQYVEHISVGDIIRVIDQELKEESSKNELIDYLKANYRGFLSVEEIIEAQLKRNTQALLPTEFVLALVKREIDRRGRKSLFIDGFPRDLDQVSYSLYFRNLIDYRDDMDFFILISVPEAVIDERIKHRVVCPKCQTPRNLKLLSTKKVGYDKKEKKFFLVCDNPSCDQARMVGKEGDVLGIEAFRERLDKDGEIMEKAFSLHGIPKVFLCNSVAVNKARQLVDDYEITPEYVYTWDEKSGQVKISEKPWIVKDDFGVPSYSLLPPPVVVSLIKQIAEII